MNCVVFIDLIYWSDQYIYYAFLLTCLMFEITIMVQTAIIFFTFLVYWSDQFGVFTTG